MKPSPLGVSRSLARGLYYEDLSAGQAYATPGLTVTEESIIRFALEWDMQPFHVDAIAAKNSIFGTLTASGLQTLMLSYRLYYQLGLFDGTALAGLGFKKVRFVKPLRPGATISVIATVDEMRDTKKQDRGLVVMELQTFDHDRELLLQMDLSLLLAKRLAL